jgi:hypothetical protein
MQQSAGQGVAPHGIQWHFAAHDDTHSPRHDPFRALQRRFNQMLGQHPAITHNAFLDKLEEGSCGIPSFLNAMTQQAIFWRQLVLVREHHALILAEQQLYPETRFEVLPVAVCFDAHGVPWCPPVPEGGLGDPYALSERLHEWWATWQRSFPVLADRGYILELADPATLRLCEFLDRYYNANDPDVALGTMIAIESTLSTDCWERLRQAGDRLCQKWSKPFPMSGFFITSEMHARLQARHAIHLLDRHSHEEGGADDSRVFDAIRDGLSILGEFEQAQAALLLPEMH